MAKRKALFGVNTFIEKKKRKRRGRVSKSPNKRYTKKRRIGQGNPS